MRRKEKLLHITKLNNKLNESKFSWDGKFVNEDDSITEHHSGEYAEKIMSMTISEFLDTLSAKDKMAYEIVEKVIEKHFNETTDEGITGLPADMELVDEDCGCEVNESEPTDNQVLKMKKKIKITENQYKKLKNKLKEGLSFNDNTRNAAIYRGSEVFEKFLSSYDINFNPDELNDIANALISGIRSSLESHYTDMTPNAGSSPDEYDDGMTHDQFHGETHGY